MALKPCSYMEEYSECSNLALEGNVLCSHHLIEEFRTLTKHHHRANVHLKKQVKKYKEALAAIQAEVGTSTLAWKIADDALWRE